ncbi:MAG: prolyl oligopeptidase family serine peptidase [Verrucomicrobiota bacterium]
MKALLLPFLVVMTASAAPKESTGDFESSTGDALSYLLIEPDPAAFPAEAKRPLVVFLHGSGERGSDLEKVKTHGPPKQALEGLGLPFVVLAPQCPPKQWWKIETVIELVKEVAANHDIDPKRIHLTGLSMGGYGTWAILAEEPDLFASAVPICGGGDPSTVEAFKNLPIWAFHGEEDDVVPVEKTREMETALREAGAKQLRTTYFPGVDHDSWTPAYSDPALYAWMMLQTK